MPTAGPNAPGTAATAESGGGANQPWVNTANALNNNDVYTTCSPDTSEDTEYLDLTNFGFSIPVNVTIDDISFTVHGKSVPDATLQTELRTGSTNPGPLLSFISAENPITISASPSVWFWAAITPANINASTFGLRVRQLDLPAPTVYSIDYCTCTITYTLFVGAPPLTQTRRINHILVR